MPRWATRQQTVSTHPLVRKSPIYTPFPTSSIPTRVIRSSHYSQASGLLVTKSINLSDRTIIHQHSTTQHSVTRHRPRNNMTMTPLRPASDNRSGFPPVRVLRNNFTDYVTFPEGGGPKRENQSGEKDHRTPKIYCVNQVPLKLHQLKIIQI